MGIMAAGMHRPSRLGGIGRPGLLGDGECVHISPDEQRWPRPAGVERGDQPIRAGNAVLHCEPESLEPGPSRLGSALLLKCQLGMTMDITPDGAEFVLHALGTTEQRIGRHREFPSQRAHVTFLGGYWPYTELSSRRAYDISVYNSGGCLPDAVP